MHGLEGKELEEQRTGSGEGTGGVGSRSEDGKAGHSRRRRIMFGGGGSVGGCLARQCVVAIGKRLCTQGL